jgi:hypothetical protein
LLIMDHCQGIGDRRMRIIAGPRHARKLIFLERAAIGTMVLTKGYVAYGGGLRGKKWVGLKPLFPMPAIAYLCNVIAQGHMEEGANGKRASA